MECMRFLEKIISWFESDLPERVLKDNIDKKFLDAENLKWQRPSRVYIRSTFAFSIRK